MNKIIFLIIIFLLAGRLPAADDPFNCFSIVVGKEASADGSVLLAHNEDDYGRLLVNIHKVPPQDHRHGDVFIMKSGAVLPQVAATPGLLWLEIPENDFADSYVNEYGVALTSDACPSREDRPELSEGGIGFSLRRLVAERAKTAREGVRIAGELISRYGYNASGRTYMIADAGEGWLLHAVKGKHWVARRVPDKEVAVIANRYTITGVKLEDKENFQGSPDIVDYAVSRGWYDPQKDGDFDFARAYSDRDAYADMRNVMRQWRGTDLLADKSFKLDDPLPFSFKPHRDMRLLDLFRVLRDHYEGTKYDASDHYRNGSPNNGRRTAPSAPSPRNTPSSPTCAAGCPPRSPTSSGSPAAAPTATPFRRGTFRWPGFRTAPAARPPMRHGKTISPPCPPRRSKTRACLSTPTPGSPTPVDRQYRGRIEKVQKVWRNFEDFLFADLEGPREGIQLPA